MAHIGKIKVADGELLDPGPRQENGYRRMPVGRMHITRKQRTFFAVVFILACAASLAYAPGAAAQPASFKPGDEFRPLYATIDDIAEGKRLVDSSCASCHGAYGISADRSVPNLAGQRAPYLYLELIAYQSGARPDTPMTAKVKFLSADALMKVAAYYASLDPPQPGPGSAAPAILDPIQAGKTVSVACAGCHGDIGISKIAGMPSLVAFDPQYLAAAMKAYRNGQRKNDLMKSMLASLSEADINRVALFYALQKPGRAQTPAPGDKDAGKAATASCSGCHGDIGVSGNPATPSLAGQDAQYLAAAVNAYKSGSRGDETMKSLVSALDEATIKNISAYYASLTPQPVTVRKPLTAEEWTARCDRCHGLNGNSTNARIPALAAQNVEYLERVLHAYQSGARRSPEMAAMSDVLNDDDVKNLAAHYSRQKAKAVLFITVPEK
jgi:cytochrome c553